MLLQDARALDAIRSRAEESTSALEEELARLTQELADEQREVDEIEQCDQDYLNELRESVKEQT
jgi:kinetochore protein Spc7/SPC105